jgi:uncharacterized protein (TIGR00661 family)
MARIIYGVSGEGSGHSSRARAMITHLEANGHRVKVASYDRGHADLSPSFDTLEIQGLHIGTHDNRVSIARTFTDNLARVPDGIRYFKNLRALFDTFDPHCVITDFEPQTAHLARRRGIPLISLDNQHRMRYMTYPCPRRLRKDAMVTETVIRAMIPPPDVALVTTFWFGETKNDRTFLFPPILRREVREISPRDGDRVLVYATQRFQSLLARLPAFTRERFVVYGFAREGNEGNLEFKPFSRSCRGQGGDRHGGVHADHRVVPPRQAVPRATDAWPVRAATERAAAVRPRLRQECTPDDARDDRGLSVPRARIPRASA